jgi:rhamnosyltransferase
MEQRKKATVGVAIITHKAKHHLSCCLPPLLNSSLKPLVLVVNSSSNDGTVEQAQALGAETLVIPRADFNHGATREMARCYLKTDIVVMVTPDAYAVDKYVLERLVEPILANKAKISYARQIPHKEANFFETFAREFNYPVQSHIRGIENVSEYGVYTFFCSNSFAAYCNETLKEIGGFRSVLLGEDTIAAISVLKKGYKIAYTAEAVVHHSHKYTLKQEFQRHFDIGLSRIKLKQFLEEGGGDNKRGKEYVQKMLLSLIQIKPYLLPYACLQTFTKWVGYKVGSHSENAPLWIKRAFSSQDFYWHSKNIY